jgi:uncharacterized membrane protein YphA (DoxX/SURF4 family)
VQKAINKWIKEIARFLLVLLFVYTGCSKLLTHVVFLEQLQQVNFLKPFASSLSIALPVAELLTGIAIAIHRTQYYGLWSAALLMTAFTTYVAIMLALDKTQRPCSCGGVIKAMSWQAHLYLNIFFMLLAWYSLLFRGNTRE